MFRRILLLALLAFTFAGPPMAWAADQVPACSDMAQQTGDNDDRGAASDDCDTACLMRCAVVAKAPASNIQIEALAIAHLLPTIVSAGASEWNMAPPTPPPNKILDRK